jgi:hypothetical protein
VILLVALSGCGGGGDSNSTPAGQASAPAAPTVRCPTAMVGTPSRSWRREATSSGPVGFFGAGRDFLAPSFTRQDKMPLIVEGQKAVTLSITARDSSHARLQAPTSPPWTPQIEIRLVPCRDQPRTAWAAGLLLRNRRPVTLIVRQSGEPERRLRVGRV